MVTMTTDSSIDSVCGCVDLLDKAVKVHAYLLPRTSFTSSRSVANITLVASCMKAMAILSVIQRSGGVLYM